jgi:hypothetical protein
MSSKTRSRTATHQPTAREQALSGHIFSVSAGLVGVCLTVIGLLNLFRTPGKVQGIADDLIAIDAMVFLLACIFAYFGIRTSDEHRWRRLQLAR